jgi:putative methyltransferase (TIGR04325 family)
VPRLAEITEIFPDFASALAASGRGYNDAEIAEVIAFKTAAPFDKRTFAPEQAINSILAVGIAAAEIADRPLNVLDFGGGCGFHYFRVMASIRAPLQWAIVETPTMAERTIKIAQGKFKVFTEIALAADSLGRIDLVHTSGALSYVSNPLAALKALVGLQPRYFMLARFPVWGGRQTVALQSSPLSGNGIGPMPSTIPDREVKYPVTFTNFDDVMRAFNDYEIVLSLDQPVSYYEIRRHRVSCISLFFRKKGV